MREELQNLSRCGGSHSLLLCPGPLRTGFRTRWPEKGHWGRGCPCRATPVEAVSWGSNGSLVQHSASLPYRPEEIVCCLGSLNMEQDKSIDSC